jgi:5-formyltetrahydrofolate cyclo-ligase
MQESLSTENPPITQEWLGIWYTPMPDEVDPRDLEIVRVQGLEPWKRFAISKDKDPFAAAAELVQEAGDRKVYIFVPGRRFDRVGTRIGRGSGWMDRFLSKVPHDWLRIGVCGPKQWSEDLLKREAWDVPMDWVLHVFEQSR